MRIIDILLGRNRDPIQKAFDLARTLEKEQVPHACGFIAIQALSHSQVRLPPSWLKELKTADSQRAGLIQLNVYAESGLRIEPALDRDLWPADDNVRGLMVFDSRKTGEGERVSHCFAVVNARILNVQPGIRAVALDLASSSPVVAINTRNDLDEYIRDNSDGGTASIMLVRSRS